LSALLVLAQTRYEPRRIYPTAGPESSEESSEETTEGTTEETSAAPTTSPTQDMVYCPDDWFDAKELGCYKFLKHKTNLTWVDAEEECENIGGYLAEPSTTRQSEFLNELTILEAELTGINYWYIGLTDLGREGEWFWMHSRAGVGASSWAQNRPRSTAENRADCGVLAAKKGLVVWEDTSCTDVIPNKPVAPVCQTDRRTSEITTSPPATTTSPSLECREGWSAFQGHCYRWFGTANRWDGADKTCFVNRGRLASVHSAEEDEFLQNLNGSGWYGFWLGGYPLGDTWRWSDGSQLDYVGGW